MRKTNSDRKFQAVGRYSGTSMPLRQRISLPDRYRSRRLQLNLTQAEVASAMGVSASRICRWESGKERIPPERRAQLQDVLFCSALTTKAPRGAYRNEDRLSDATLAAIQRGRSNLPPPIPCRHGCGRMMPPGPEAQHARYCPKKPPPASREPIRQPWGHDDNEDDDEQLLAIKSLMRHG